MSTERRARLAFIGCGSFATASIFPQIPLIAGDRSRCRVRHR